MGEEGGELKCRMMERIKGENPTTNLMGLADIAKSMDIVNVIAERKLETQQPKVVKAFEV